MPTRDLTLAMVGSGGDGVVTMGDMMAQAGARDGLNVIKVEAYGPQIRGGESSCTLRMSAEPISAQGDAVDVLVVFNWADFSRFKGEVVPKADAVDPLRGDRPDAVADVKTPDRAEQRRPGSPCRSSSSPRRRPGRRPPRTSSRSASSPSSSASRRSR